MSFLLLALHSSEISLKWRHITVNAGGLLLWKCASVEVAETLTSRPI